MYNFCEIKKNLERIDKMLNRRTFIKTTSLATLGLMFAGCGNGHAHYSAANCISKVGITVDFDGTPEKFLNEIIPAAVKKARENGMTSIFGSGWRLLTFEKNMPTRQQLDAICSDIPIYIEISTKRLKNTTKKEKCILFWV